MPIKVCSICSKQLIPNRSGRGMCEKCYHRWYYQNNKEQIKANAAKWQKENRPKRRAIEQRYRDKYRQKNPLPPKFKGPCIVCGSYSPRYKRFIKKMCRPCYRKSRYQRAQPKNCIDCGKIIGTKSRINRCRKCNYHYKYQREQNYRDGFRRRAKKYRQTKNGRIKGRAHVRKRRAKISQVENTLTEEQWQSVLEKFKHRCAYCGSKKNVEMDHVIPISKNGGHTIRNVVPACRSCNASKRDNKAPANVQTLLV